jgi:glycosyltransferase involved in cell wall biosynthesis
MSVSVAITTYNAADYLREAIRSAVEQTRPPDEIVVIDDGSRDHTREVCESFGAIIKYFYQPQDGTMGASAQIRAILETSGDFIAFLDHDDRWLPTKLEKQLQVMEENPEAGAVFTGVQMIDGGGQIVGEPVMIGPSGDVFHKLLHNCYYAHSAGLVRRTSLARSGLQDVDAIAGDWDQWLRIARYYPILMVMEPLTEYRMHTSNFIGDVKRLVDGARNVLSRHRDRLHPDCRECLQAWQEGWDYMSATLARDRLDHYYAKTRNGQLAGSFPFLWQAVRTSPKEVLRPRRFLGVVANALFSKFRGARAETPAGRPPRVEDVERLS